MERETDERICMHIVGDDEPDTETPARAESPPEPEESEGDLLSAFGDAGDADAQA